MKNPRTLQELKNDPRVHDVWWEVDGYGNTHEEMERPSIWVGMKGGWYNYRDLNSIHAKTVKEACRKLREEDWKHDPSRDPDSMCCKECGSINVRTLAWIDPNTAELIDDAGPYAAKEYNFCEDCGEHVALVLKGGE